MGRLGDSCRSKRRSSKVYDLVLFAAAAFDVVVVVVVVNTVYTPVQKRLWFQQSHKGALRRSSFKELRCFRHSSNGTDHVERNAADIQKPNVLQVRKDSNRSTVAY